MKRIFLLSALAFLAVVSCTEKEAGLQEGTKNSGEIAVAPFNSEVARRTKGYVQGDKFFETYRTNLHDGSTTTYAREMKLSAYLYPQNGEQKNYFVGKTYAKGASDDLWHADPAIYWPVGGTMDFLAYSLSGEEGSSKNVTAVWNSDNAAKQVVLTVPGENTQNDILFASAAGIKSSDKKAVDMKFNHAQAWLEFAVTGTPAGIVHLQKIELEDVYNAGTLTISNNSGNAVATWDFAGEEKQNIAVDNFNVSKDLTATPMYFDMLIPQQTKTNFVIYYTLGTDTKVLKYRFSTDLKTWLMGEKYVYNIAINSSEVTVNPTVTTWEPAVIETKSTVKISYDSELGKVEVEGLGDPIETRATTETKVYTTDTWGAQATLKAVNGRFIKWSDGNTENPRTITITGDAEYAAEFGVASYKITAKSKEYTPSRGTASALYIADNQATITATPAEGYKFFRWTQGGVEISRENPQLVVAEADLAYVAEFIPEEAIAALFSVAADKQIVFTSGNLWYDTTTTPATFSIESDQTAYPTSYDVTHVGHFYWSKTASVAYAKDYSDTKSTTDVFFTNETVSTPNPSFTCNGKTGVFRTLSGGGVNCEWYYLLRTRTVNGGTDEGKTCQRVTLDGKKGLLIYPDGYTEQVENTKWKEIPSIPEGCVFLPAAGERDHSSLYNAGSAGRYWSASPDGGNANLAYRLTFYDDNLYSDSGYLRAVGSSVRLVSEL